MLTMLIPTLNWSLKLVDVNLDLAFALSWIKLIVYLLWSLCSFDHSNFFFLQIYIKAKWKFELIAICKWFWTYHAKCYLHYQPTSKRLYRVMGNDHEKTFGYLGITLCKKAWQPVFRMFKKCQLTPCWACKFKWHVTQLWSHVQVLYTYIAHHVYVFNYTYNAIIWCISNYTYMILCIFLWAQVRSCIWNYIWYPFLFFANIQIWLAYRGLFDTFIYQRFAIHHPHLCFITIIHDVLTIFFSPLFFSPKQDTHIMWIIWNSH